MKLITGIFLCANVVVLLIGSFNLNNYIYQLWESFHILYVEKYLSPPPQKKIGKYMGTCDLTKKASFEKQNNLSVPTCGICIKVGVFYPAREQ